MKSNKYITTSAITLLVFLIAYHFNVHLIAIMFAPLLWGFVFKKVHKH